MQFSRLEIFFIVMIATAVITAGSSFFLQNIGLIFFGKITAGIESQNNVLTNTSNAENVSDAPLLPLPPEKLANPPEIIKAVYVTGYSAGSKKYLNYLTQLFKTTEINSVVIDIKDYSGLLSYKSSSPDIAKYNLYDGAIPDIDALIRFFHGQNIYVIGRIVVFEDPAFAKIRPDLAIYDKAEAEKAAAEKLQAASDAVQEATQEPAPAPRLVLWRDNNGLFWLDPSSKDVWDYNVSLTKDVFSHGFDEVNYDYIRFPSDGKIGNMGFPVWDQKTLKSEVIKEFFNYLRANIPDDPPSSRQGETTEGRGKLSVDLFGQTTTNRDDMGIGQIIENAFENFDYISPMVYPSHYIGGFMGFDNPADHPYEIINYSMATALKRENDFYKQKQNEAIKASRPAEPPDAEIGPAEAAPELPAPVLSDIVLAKFRPWLQDFNMGAYYTADMVEAEINATQDALGDGYNGFMLWNPSNIYTIGAVLK